MPHKFTDSDALEGVWYKDNGRRYCAWRFDQVASTLYANRGVVAHSTEVELPAEQLREQLPQLALKLVQDQILH